MSKIHDFEIIQYEELGSTQEEARNFITSGKAIEGQVIVAKSQTTGRGKYGRVWYASKGDIMLTILVKPEHDANKLAQICYVAALAVSETIQQLDSGIEISYKWINDVLINDRKVCGILLEKVEHNFVLVGIGINVHHQKVLDEL